MPDRFSVDIAAFSGSASPTSAASSSGLSSALCGRASRVPCSPPVDRHPSAGDSRDAFRARGRDVCTVEAARTPARRRRPHASHRVAGHTPTGVDVSRQPPVVCLEVPRCAARETSVNTRCRGRKMCPCRASESAGLPTRRQRRRHPRPHSARSEQLRDELDEFERQQVARALSAGRDLRGDRGRRWASRGKPCTAGSAISAAAASRRTGRRPRRRCVWRFEYAQAEARALEAPRLGPEHVVLGILRAGDRCAARALEEAGVELDHARETTRAAARRGLAGGRRFAPSSPTRCATPRGRARGTSRSRTCCARPWRP